MKGQFGPKVGSLKWKSISLPHHTLNCSDGDIRPVECRLICILHQSGLDWDSEIFMKWPLYHRNDNSKVMVRECVSACILQSPTFRFLITTLSNVSQTTEQAFRHIQNIVDFSKNIMKPLLGEKYVHHGVSCIDFSVQLIREMWPT